MGALLSLWLPILVSAVAIFVASSLIHMLLKWHNADYGKLANEDEVRATLRAGSPAPGLYVLPHCADMKQMQEPGLLQKFIEGPVGFVTLRRAGPPAIGTSLLQWFLFTLIISAVTAWLALQAYGLDADPARAACLCGVVSALVYGGGNVPEGIWMGRPWRSVLKHVIDGLIYGAVCALAFYWLWP